MPVDVSIFLVSAINFFQIAFQFIKYLRRRRGENRNVLIALQNNLNLALNFLLIAFKAIKLIREQRIGRRLYKPHLLLRLLIGYR